MTIGSAGFIELVSSKLKLKGRQIRFKNFFNLGGPSYADTQVVFINLPEGIGSAGGGAERLNNQMILWVHGFGKEGPDSPPPTGKVKVELVTTVFPHRLRAKTATPEKIAEYLADFINKVVDEVEPKFTHTKI